MDQSKTIYYTQYIRVGDVSMVVLVSQSLNPTGHGDGSKQGLYS